MEPYFEKGDYRAEDVSVLASFYGISDFEIKNITRFKNVILDSGAFSFMRGKRVQNWDEYVEKYADFINAYKVEKFFELDIDNIIGIAEVERLRAKMEKLTGKQPIPVWHINRGKNYFLEMCNNYPYVALGGIVGAKTQTKIYKRYQEAFPWFIQEAHRRGCKIHGLGYTHIEGLHKNHFDSVDSTTWLVGAKYGNICRITPNGGKQEHRKGTRVINSRELARINFDEWLKLQWYAEKYL